MKPGLPQVAHILSLTDENARVRTFTLDCSVQAEPGQFVMAWLPGVDEKPFSLVRADPVTLSIARVGPFSEAVRTLKPGGRLWLRGPLGRPFTLPERIGTQGARGQEHDANETVLPASCLFVAGGYGVAPLHFLAERALAAGWQVVTVIGARTADGVIFAGRFAALGAQVVVATDDGSLGERGLATEVAARLLDEHRFVALYACGPEPMLQEVERLAHSRCIPAQLSYERHMRCAVGVCGSCAHDGWLVCRDGPVLSVEP